MTLSPGTRLGSYKILAPIGAGGMGIVYKAHDTKLNRTVALKFIAHEVAEGGRVSDRFLQEARAASALDHPNIGTIHGIEQAPDGRSFIVMAYYEGETLAQRIRRGPLPSGQAVDIAIQMARGLAEAHAHNIVHCDIKSSNVILNPNGLAKIVDFGLARFVTSTVSTQSAGISGTAAYMAPEQASGKSVDHRADIWSLGIVLWEMCTGCLPFNGANLPAMLFEVVHSPPPALPESVPEPVRPILYKALAKDPSARYQSAREMLADLERSLPSGESTRTVATSKKELKRLLEGASPTRTKAPSRRGWWVTCAIVVALVAMALPFRSRLTPTPTRHIAVLPFENTGNNPNNEALTDGLLENLTNRLSNLETIDNSLWVVPAGEVRRRKVNDPSAAQREFGATLVVTGAVQRDGSGVHLALHLVDASSMRQLGGEMLDERAGDLAELQTRAVSTLAKWMKVSLPPSEKQTGGAQPLAYESYLRALGYMQRYDKPGNIDQAIAQFQQAVKADPKFAIAFAGLGDAYLIKNHLEKNRQWIDSAMAASRRAAEIDNQSAPVHITLGRIQRESGKLDLASQEFQQALRLDPRNADALSGLAVVYEKQGRVPDATEMFRRAAALRPDYWDGYNKLGEFYFRQKRSPEAEVQFRRAVELTPDNWVAYVNLGAALQTQAKYDDAAKALEKSIQLNPSYMAYTNLGSNYYRQMKLAQAMVNIEKALAINDKDYRTWTNYALANRWLVLKGDKAAAEKARSGYRHAWELLKIESSRQPGNSDVLDRLAMMYAFFGKRDEALRYLESAKALNTDAADFDVVRAEVYEMLGQRKLAIDALRSALTQGMKLETVKRNPEVQGILADPNFTYPQ